MTEIKQQYHQAKQWQLICFALLQAGSNLFMLAMNFSSYSATGVYGIAVVSVSLLLTSTRIWDAITDPIAGFLIDRINTPFGRFRPLIILGYAIMTITTLVMFFMGEGHGVVMFMSLYVIYIIGYTIVTCICKAAIPIMTNDPKQRPIIGRWGAFCTCTLSTVISIYIGKVLYPKYGGLGPAALREMLVTAIILAGICVVAAVIALGEKDKPENIALLSKNAMPSLKDCWHTVKGNRPLQMLIVAAATDKLASQTYGNSTVNIMLYGILIANYSFSGGMSLYAYIPSLIFIFMITKYARRMGSRKALLSFSWAGIILSVAFLAFFVMVDPTKISQAAVPTAIFVVLMVARSAVIQANASMTNIMIADCADYEMYRSGKFMPGLVGTVFSFVDKLVSSLGATVVGLAVAIIGFTEQLPQIGDAATPALFWVTMFLFIGMPLLGWICSVVALKFYDLTPEKMAEVQKFNAELRAKNAQEK